MSDEQQQPPAVNELEAQAKLKQAQANAVKAEGEAAKARADAIKAEADAAKAERELPGAAELAAKARKAIAEADRDAADARTKHLSALIPDLSSLKDSSTVEVKEGGAFLAPFLTYGGLEHVAQTICNGVYGRLKTPVPRVLVTTDPNLTNADALYHDVMDGLVRLRQSAVKLLASLEQKGVRPAFEPTTALAAIAGAVPGILALFSAKRTVTTGAAAAPDSLAAAAAVISALHNQKSHDSIVLVLDEFRLVPDSGVHAAARALADERDRLVGKKVASGIEQDAAEVALAKADREEKALAKEAAPKDPKAHGIALETARQAIDRHQQIIDRTTREIGMIEALLTGIDSFTTAIGTVPAGARRSPLTTAALHEQLRGRPADATLEGTPAKPGEPAFTHVLLIKAQPGGSQHILDNRPLWFQDKFSTLVEISVTYVLITTATSEVTASGTATRVARAYGEMGKQPVLEYLDATQAVQ
jgi:hypothetical protein